MPLVYMEVRRLAGGTCTTEPADSIQKTALENDTTARVCWAPASLLRRSTWAEALRLFGYEGMMRLEATIPAASRLKLKQAEGRIVQSYVESRKAEKAAECWEKLRPDRLSAARQQ
jgi:hypothetical protein